MEFKRLLKEANVTQVSIAKKFGMSRKAINQWASKKRREKPNIFQITVIAKMTKRTRDEVIDSIVETKKEILNLNF